MAAGTSFRHFIGRELSIRIVTGEAIADGELVARGDLVWGPIDDSGGRASKKDHEHASGDCQSRKQTSGYRWGHTNSLPLV